jgi:hypothetical protein
MRRLFFGRNGDAGECDVPVRRAIGDAPGCEKSTIAGTIQTASGCRTKIKWVEQLREHASPAAWDSATVSAIDCEASGSRHARNERRHCCDGESDSP